jgi:hypothetical protein
MIKRDHQALPCFPSFRTSTQLRKVKKVDHRVKPGDNVKEHARRAKQQLAVKPLKKIYSGFQNMQITLYRSCPVPLRGALANVINAGQDAMDAEGAETKAPEADGEVVWS